MARRLFARRPANLRRQFEPPRQRLKTSPKTLWSTPRNALPELVIMSPVLIVPNIHFLTGLLFLNLFIDFN